MGVDGIQTSNVGKENARIECEGGFAGNTSFVGKQNTSVSNNGGKMLKLVVTM